MIKLLPTLFLLFVINIQGQEISKRNDLQTIPEVSINTQASEIEGQKLVVGKFNYIEIGGYSTLPISRHIDVYLEEKDFSEENLKVLFEYISK